MSNGSVYFHLLNKCIIDPEFYVQKQNAKVKTKSFSLKDPKHLFPLPEKAVILVCKTKQINQSRKKRTEHTFWKLEVFFSSFKLLMP